MTKDNKEFKVSGDELLNRIRQLIHQGNIRRIINKDETGRIFMEIPLSIGVAGVAIVPVLVSVGALAALVNNFTIEVIKKEEENSDNT
ncbi:MAG: DUF4342 domain-containing protein [Bacteroidota bacterium]